MEFEEKITNIETIHEGKITTYQLADVTLPDGRKAEREIVRHDAAAAVIAFTEEQKLLTCTSISGCDWKNNLRITRWSK